MLSILARILFIIAYGVLGLDRLHNCLRLHDTGFVMSRLRLFVRPLFVLLCHYCFLALQCYHAIAFFITLIVYHFGSTRSWQQSPPTTIVNHITPLLVPKYVT